MRSNVWRSILPRLQCSRLSVRLDLPSAFSHPIAISLRFRAQAAVQTHRSNALSARSHARLWRDHLHLRKVRAVATRVARKDRQAQDLRMRADEEVWQHARADAASPAVLQARFSPRGTEPDSECLSSR